MAQTPLTSAQEDALQKQNMGCSKSSTHSFIGQQPGQPDALTTSKNKRQLVSPISLELALAGTRQLRH